MPVKKALKVTVISLALRVLPIVSIPVMEATVKTPDEEMDPVICLLPTKSAVEGTGPRAEGTTRK